ncbi:unnamed protein product [Spirodela intermedia]|uniref:Uncharacterized protein n=1 Tax=Spirodela intermedia TaxID=51605 RepID=A0A7I8JSK0_SPIIN|nr:unnamed protein product [Spirodela intermedia]CAA6673156.1 unnamed protein product [Spirodela intermedia]
MNQWSALAACEEVMGPFVPAMGVDRREAVFCPRPRRLSQRAGGDHVRPVPIRWQLGPSQADPCDSKPGGDVLDIILAKDASSPPYFCGSPPMRSSNPLVLDARFGEEKPPPPPPLLPPVAAAPPSSGGAARQGGCVRNSFGPNPAAVRVEGFDCLAVDHRRRSSRGITAVA